MSSKPGAVRATESGQLLIYLDDEHRLEQSFQRFHRENPNVYETLVRLARRWRRQRPDSKCGMKMLYEVARWTLSLQTQGEPIRLNNNYHAFYARMMMERETDLVELFHIRQQKG